MRLLRRLAYLLRLRSRQDDLRDELAFHREMVERDAVGRGASPESAPWQARRTMGNETLMREEARAVWLWPSLEARWQDVRYALRDLGRNPAFTLGVTLTLALGIGANTAMFSLVDRLMFRPPAHMIDPASVHQIYKYRTLDGVESETGGQYARYVDLARWSTTSAETATFVSQRLAVGTGEATRISNVAAVSATFFSFFDARPSLGRYFLPAEDAAPDPAAVAVISHALWTTQYGARKDVIGSTLQIDAVAYTIIGVAPAGFTGVWPYQAPAAFIPVATFVRSRTGRAAWATTYGYSTGLRLIARGKPGTTVAAMKADFTNALWRSFQVQYEAEGRASSLPTLHPRVAVASVLSERGPEASSTIRVAAWLSGVTLMVLLIACANVANLTLARAIRRRREIAVRLALGVSRWRLFAQLLTEGTLLACLGGTAGVVLAMWGGNILAAMFVPGADHVTLLSDTRTLLFTGAVVLGVGVITGLAPMAQVERGNLTANLKSGAREGTRQHAPLRTALLLTQTALCVVLLIGAGLFVSSLRHVRAVRLGFDADSVIEVTSRMRDVKLDSAGAAALRLRLLDAARQVPGVTHASLQESIPFNGSSSRALFVRGIDSTERLGEFDFNSVSADYFQTMGTRIVRGRGVDPADRDGTPLVAVVSPSMAAALWPGQEPIGQCIRLDADTMPCRHVVGVAEEILSQSLEPDSKLFYYYLPAAQWRPQDGGMVVRVRGDARRMVEPLRTRLQREMPGTAYVTVRTLAELVDPQMNAWIIGARAFTAFGALALLLAAVGLYSVMAYHVAQRRHELGVRLALGAARIGIVRLVVMESLRLALAGVLIGGAIALVGGRWIGPLLFHESARDPAVFAGVIVTLVGVAAAASAVPALRAARMDPTAALGAD